MKYCAKCGNGFPAKIVIDGKKRNLKNRKYCITCSPFGDHNTVKLDRENSISTICSRCDKLFDYDRSKGHKRTVCNTCVVNKRRPERKAFAVSYKGGQCLVCEYSASPRALVFHHANPESKHDDIAAMYLASMERLMAELDKCVLLCCRCHMEVHDGLISQESLDEKEIKRKDSRVAQLVVALNR